jgi:hypothetical protein
MKLIYVAGPFRGETAWDIEQNTRRVEELGLKIAHLGHMPLMPHCNTRFFHGQCDDQFWIDGTLLLLSKCDAMLVAPGWEESSGTKGEISYCQKHDLPYFYTLEDLKIWLKA